jgi:hypothetical protein
MRVRREAVGKDLFPSVRPDRVANEVSKALTTLPAWPAPPGPYRYNRT